MTKPIIKTYTIKDYRTFKKDAIPASTSSTGKLGFDFESDHYKQKVHFFSIIKKILSFSNLNSFYQIEVAQKKGDYAERVKARNRILLAEQKRNEDNDSSKQSQEPSKTQRVFYL